jgi:hypothetical protein
LNYAKGVNHTWITVDFGGERVEYSIPTMVINGMLFGDRNIYFDSTSISLPIQITSSTRRTDSLRKLSSMLPIRVSSLRKTQISCKQIYIKLLRIFSKHS